MVQIGKDGITDGLVAATKEALLAHELIKVKVLTEAPIDRKLAGPELAKLTAASFVWFWAERCSSSSDIRTSRRSARLPRGQTA